MGGKVVPTLQTEAGAEAAVLLRLECLVQSGAPSPHHLAPQPCGSPPACSRQEPHKEGSSYAKSQVKHHPFVPRLLFWGSQNKHIKRCVTVWFMSSPGCSLEGLMLKLKLQYFGHLMRRAHSFEKTLMLGKIEGRRRRG